MTEAIKNIVAGYMILKNRQALQDIRDHRQRLLKREPHAQPELGQHGKHAIDAAGRTEHR